jgi:hypothetical protein
MTYMVKKIHELLLVTFAKNLVPFAVKKTTDYTNFHKLFLPNFTKNFVLFAVKKTTDFVF